MITGSEEMFLRLMVLARVRRRTGGGAIVARRLVLLFVVGTLRLVVVVLKLWRWNAVACLLLLCFFTWKTNFRCSKITN